MLIELIERELGLTFNATTKSEHIVNCSPHIFQTLQQEIKQKYTNSTIPTNWTLSKEELEKAVFKKLFLPMVGLIEFIDDQQTGYKITAKPKDE